MVGAELSMIEFYFLFFLCVCLCGVAVLND